MSATATLDIPVAPTKPVRTPLDIDSNLYRAITEMVTKEHGDMAVLGEPYHDSRDRVWCDVTKNGKFVDTVYMGGKPETTFETLMRRDFKVSTDTSNPDTHSIGPTIPLPVPPPAAKPVANPVVQVAASKAR